MPDGGTLIDPLWAAYIGVIATILIGIFFTKDDKRNFENIVSNIVSFALLLATVTFTFFVLAVMGVYLIVGIAITFKKIKDLFFLFGSKTYGSVALVVLLASEKRLGLYLPTSAFELMSIYILIIAVILSSLAHLLSWLHFRKRSSSSSNSSLSALFKRSRKGARQGPKKKRAERKGRAGKGRRE